MDVVSIHDHNPDLSMATIQYAFQALGLKLFLYKLIHS